MPTLTSTLAGVPCTFWPRAEAPILYSPVMVTLKETRILSSFWLTSGVTVWARITVSKADNTGHWGSGEGDSGRRHGADTRKQDKRKREGEEQVTHLGTVDGDLDIGRGDDRTVL